MQTSKRGVLRRCSSTAIGVALSLLAAGCSSEHRAMREGLFIRVVTPVPPAFLTGPAALLLTNWASFSARLEVQSETSLGSQKSSSGQLLGRGAQLIYAPDPDTTPEARQQPGGYSFIWDVAHGRGYVLSEALQAYAPISAELRVTNLQTVAASTPAQRVAGHPCESSMVTAQSPDSVPTVFEVARALDLHHFPLVIRKQGKDSPEILSFSKVLFVPVDEGVFSPPDGFTPYPNPQAMADELAARRHNLHHKTAPPVQELPDMTRPTY